MKQQRHFFAGGIFLSLLVIGAAGIFVITGKAQVTTYAPSCYYMYEGILSYNFPAGVTTTVSPKSGGESGKGGVRGWGATCTSEEVKLLKWKFVDIQTQQSLSWCTSGTPSIASVTPAGPSTRTTEGYTVTPLVSTSIDIPLSCNPPIDLEAGEKKISLQLMKGESTMGVNTSVSFYILKPDSSVSCTSMALSSDKSSYSQEDEKIIINHQCRYPYNGSVKALYFDMLCLDGVIQHIGEEYNNTNGTFEIDIKKFPSCFTKWGNYTVISHIDSVSGPTSETKVLVVVPEKKTALSCLSAITCKPGETLTLINGCTSCVPTISQNVNQNSLLPPLSSNPDSNECAQWIASVKQLRQQRMDELTRLEKDIQTKGSSYSANEVKSANEHVESGHVSGEELRKLLELGKCDSATKNNIGQVYMRLMGFFMPDFGSAPPSSSTVNERLDTMLLAIKNLRDEIAEKNTDGAFDELLEKMDSQITAYEKSISKNDFETAKACVDTMKMLLKNEEPKLAEEDVDIDAATRSSGVFQEIYGEKKGKYIGKILGEKFVRADLVTDEKFQLILGDFADFAIANRGLEKLAPEIQQAMANATFLKKKDDIQQKRLALLAAIKDIHLDEAIESADVRMTVEQAMALMIRTNWISQKDHEAKEKLDSLLQGNVTNAKASELLQFVSAQALLNQEDIFQEGLTCFKDVPTEEWFFPSAQFACEEQYILGKNDASGNPVHKFDPGEETLYGEALAMLMRMFEIPQGSGECDKKLVAPWMCPYVDGAKNFGVDLSGKNMKKPIERLEMAKLVLRLGKNYIHEATEVILTPDFYYDSASFSLDHEGSLAVEALTKVGVFQGTSEGKFNPSQSLLRAEMATVLQRTSEKVVHPSNTCS